MTRKEANPILWLLLLAPFVVGAVFAVGVWRLTGRLAGDSLVHYLWRIPLSVYAFGLLPGMLIAWMFPDGSKNNRDLDTRDTQH